MILISPTCSVRLLNVGHHLRSSSAATGTLAQLLEVSKRQRSPPCLVTQCHPLSSQSLVGWLKEQPPCLKGDRVGRFFQPCRTQNRQRTSTQCVTISQTSISQLRGAVLVSRLPPMLVSTLLYTVFCFGLLIITLARFSYNWFTVTLNTHYDCSYHGQQLPINCYLFLTHVWHPAPRE